MLSNFTNQKEIESACHLGGGREVNSTSLFIDQKFPPNLESLIGSSMVQKACDDPGCHSLPVAFKEVEWLRPRQYEHDSSFILWAMQNPRPQSDVVESPHMPLTLLVEHLQSLTGAEARDLFVHDTKSSAGVYEISIPVAGRQGCLERKTVIVDDHIPCIGGIPIIAKNSNEKEIWVPLVVKAIAKLSGGYHQLMRGCFDESTLYTVRAICGLPLWLRPCINPDGKQNVETNYLQYWSKWRGGTRMLTSSPEKKPFDVQQLGQTDQTYQLVHGYVGEGVAEQVFSSFHKTTSGRHAMQCHMLSPTIEVKGTRVAEKMKVLITGLSGGCGESISLCVGPNHGRTGSDGKNKRLDIKQWVSDGKEFPLDVDTGRGSCVVEILMKPNQSIRIGLMVGRWDTLRRFGVSVWAKHENIETSINLNLHRDHDANAPARHTQTSPY